MDKVNLSIDLTHIGVVSITNGDKTFNGHVVVALSDDGKEVIEAGKEAHLFSRLAHPLKESVVVDVEKAAGMFRIFIKRAVGGDVGFQDINATVIVKLPLSMMELRALNDTLKLAGLDTVNIVAVDKNGQPSPWLS